MNKLEQSQLSQLTEHTQAVPSTANEPSKNVNSTHEPVEAGITEATEQPRLTSQVSVSLSNFLGHSDSGSDMSNAAIDSLVRQHSSPPPKSESVLDRSHGAGSVLGDDGGRAAASGVQIVREMSKSPRSMSPESSLDTPLAGRSAVLKEGSLTQAELAPSMTETEDDYGDEDWED